MADSCDLGKGFIMFAQAFSSFIHLEKKTFHVLTAALYQRAHDFKRHISPLDPSPEVRGAPSSKSC